MKQYSQGGDCALRWSGFRLASALLASLDNQIGHHLRWIGATVVPPLGQLHAILQRDRLRNRHEQGDGHAKIHRSRGCEKTRQLTIAVVHVIRRQDRLDASTLLLLNLFLPPPPHGSVLLATAAVAGRDNRRGRRLVRLHLVGAVGNDGACRGDARILAVVLDVLVLVLDWGIFLLGILPIILRILGLLLLLLGRG